MQREEQIRSGSRCQPCGMRGCLTALQQTIVPVQIHAIRIVTAAGGQPGGIERRADRPIDIRREKSRAHEFEQRERPRRFVAMNAG